MLGTKGQYVRLFHSYIIMNHIASPGISTSCCKIPSSRTGWSNYTCCLVKSQISPLFISVWRASNSKSSGSCCNEDPRKGLLPHRYRCLMQNPKELTRKTITYNNCPPHPKGNNNLKGKDLQTTSWFLRGCLGFGTDKHSIYKIDPLLPGGLCLLLMSVAVFHS